MRVVHVFKDYFPPTHGGIEQHIHEVVHSMSGIDFAVLTSSRTREMRVDEDEGVRVIRASEYARPVSTPLTPSWRRLLKESGADVFHFHVPNPFGELMLLASRAKVPVVATYHADIVGRAALVPFFAPFQQAFLRKARSLIVSSPRLRDTSPSLARHKHKVEIVPFGVDLAKWAQRPPEADDIRARYRQPIVLFLGRLAYYKGVDVLIEAMKTVEAMALIVGEGPMRTELEQTARHPRVRDRVVFVGEVTESLKKAYYHAADVFALPATSRAEAFGISMLEAMACGTPIVSTELGTGTSWVNQNLETGLVVEPSNPRALAGALKSLLGDDERRASMGTAAADAVRSRFTKQQMLDSIRAIYESAAGSGHAARL